MGFEISLPFLIMIAVGLFAVVGMALAAYNEKKRREAIRLVAEQMELTFLADGDADRKYDLSGLPLFSKGRSRRISNMLCAETDDVEMSIFDYRFTTGSGKNSQTHRQSVAFFRSADLNLPDFELRPQNFLHGIGKAFGYQDIDFEDHPAFSKVFLLRGQDEKRIRATFDGGIISELQQLKGVCIEGQGQDLIYYYAAKRQKPDQLKDFMQQGFKVFVMFRNIRLEG